jgi:hypothetical protein
MMEEIQILQEGRINTPTAEANLWLAVIEQAIEDLSNPDLREAALEWFTSTSDRPATFRWICDHLHLSASAVCTALARRESRNNLPSGKFLSSTIASGKRRFISKTDSDQRVRGSSRFFLNRNSRLLPTTF